MNIWTPKTNDSLSYYQRGQYILIWRFAILFTIVFGILSAVFAQLHTTLFLLYLGVFSLSAFSVVYLSIYKKPRTIFWLFTVSASAAVIFSMNAVVHTLHYPDLMWIVCIVLFAFIGLKFRYALIFVIIHASSLLYFVLFRINGHFEYLQTRTDPELYTAALEITFAFLVLCSLLYQNIKFQNYAQQELRKTNASLEKQNSENTLLLKEVHHRVKNNLQIVISLLRMQNASVENEITRQHFNSAINRIMTISLIHNKLYESSVLSQIMFNQYIEELIEDIKMLHTNNDVFDVEFESNIDLLDMNSMIPLGLIINELVTNSVKHASADGDPLKINIRFQQEEGNRIKMEYSDNGTWKAEQKRGFGLELIESLSEQLDGKFTREGSSVRIEFVLG